MLIHSQKYDVGIINASPISMGLLSNRGPPPWHPASQGIRSACKQAAEYCQVWINLKRGGPLLKSIVVCVSYIRIVEVQLNWSY